MLIVLISIGLLAIAGILFLVSSLYIDRTPIAYYSKTGNDTEHIDHVVFKNDKDREEAILAIKTEYFNQHLKDNKNTSCKSPEELDYSKIFWYADNYVSVVKVKRTRLRFRRFYHEWELAAIIMIIATVIGGIGVFGSGIAAICNYAPTIVQQTETEYQSKFDTLVAKEQVLYNTLNGVTENNVHNTTTTYIVYDMGTIAANITDYNNDVIEFKQTIYRCKIRSNSIWLGWFENPAFRSVPGYNKNATSYKDIFGDNLKIFVPANSL